MPRVQHLEPGERSQLLAFLQRRSPQDVYFEGWVRAGDINIAQRMWMWRPQGEVLVLRVLREQMIQEAQQELNLI